MKTRVADYIARACADYGIRQAFSVVGGGAMNLNDAFGHSEDIDVVYNQHEQACAMAAEGYARIDNRMAAVVVTTGPGGLNTLNGVAGAYVDSVPMIVISGQVRRDSFSKTTGLKLRAMGDQEFDIVPSVRNMTKYAHCIMDIGEVKYAVEKALYLADHGRMGPTWIDVPGDIQGAMFDPDEEHGYDPREDMPELGVSDSQLSEVLEKINGSERPIIYAGSAIRLSGSHERFMKLVDMLSIPVVTAWNSTDVIENSHPLYGGRAGNFGDRPGNFAVQNSDLILSLGCRLSIRQTGFNYASWAREAFVVDVDIDDAELKKPTIHVELPIHDDVHDFIGRFSGFVASKKIRRFDSWISRCKDWIRRYPSVNDRQRSQKGKCNAYAAIEMLSWHCPEGTVCVSGNGTACVVGGQVFVTKSGTRFIENSGMASMGWDLPAAIGACLALGKKEILLLTGDGSIQMNLQELQTIVHNHLPIKMVVINNEGYHSIRQSQSNFFHDRPMVGVGPDSGGDLSFPDMGKIAWAYGIPFFRIHTNDEFRKFLDDKFDSVAGPCIIEVMVDTKQWFEPKAGSMRLKDGSMVSAPLEDLKPYLDRDELKSDMIIPLWGEDRK